MTQDELKTLVGQAALQYIKPGMLVGVGTGSTVNKFIDALASIKDQIKGAVSSSVASTERLQALGTARQANVLRHWLRLSGAQVSAKQLAALQVQILACQTRGHQIDIKVGEGFVRRDGPVLGWYNF